jgi:hypothetical protein
MNDFVELRGQLGVDSRDRLVDRARQVAVEGDRPGKRLFDQCLDKVLGAVGKLPLVRFAAFQSFVCDRFVGLSVPHRRSRVRRFRRARYDFRRPPSAACSHKRFDPLVSFTPLQSATFPRLPRVFRRRAPSMGSAIPLRDINRQRTHDGVPLPPPFRPRRFSRPRRFAPPPTLQVYFTLQPRPGFTLQGVPLPPSRETSSVTRALSSLASDRYRQLATGATTRCPALRALFRVGVRCSRGRFSRPTRSLPS